MRLDIRFELDFASNLSQIPKFSGPRVVLNFLIILSGFSFGFVITGVLVFNGKS